MIRPGVPDVHITDSQDAEFAAYRALANQAVAGLILGLLGPLAFLNPMFWAIPALGVFFGGWALRRIKKAPLALTGQKLAWAGLSLSLVVAIAAPTDWLAYRHVVRSEARQVSSLCLQCLTHDEPHKAHHLAMSPQGRRPLDDDLWRYYGRSIRLRRSLEEYVQTPLVRTLLALGPRAVVRFYKNGSQSQEDYGDLVEHVYAVTYEEQGEKTSFLVAVQSLRTKLDDGKAGWQIMSTEVVKP
jgi:hypothetical protein